MSRTLSTLAHHQLTTNINDDPFLILVRVFDGVDTVYLVNNTENITSNSQVYTAFPFRLTLSEEDGEKQTQVLIEFDNVSQDLTDEIRATTSPIPCEIDLILASAPDTYEISLRDLQIREITYDATTIRATLTADDFLNSRFPADSYTPADFPGIFQ